MALNTYSLIITYNSAGQFAQNVLHYQFDDVGYATSKAASQALQTAWDTANRTKLKQCLPTDVTIVSYKGGKVSSPGGFDAFTPLPAAQIGLRAGTQSVSGVSAVFIFVPLNPAGIRGKMFLPGVSENDLSDGIFTAAYTTALDALAGTMFDDLVLAGGGTPTARFGMWRNTGKVFTQMSAAFLSRNPGTQRRRMRPV